MKRVAGEREPVVVAPVVVKPIEVGLALGLVPPDIRNVTLALERNVRDVICATAL